MYKIGIVHGRFQILHKEHIKYILAAKEKCSHLIVGITNFDCYFEGAKTCVEDPHRVCLNENPLSYYERYEMIKIALLAESIPLEDFSIVPFPIDEPSRIKNFLPTDEVFFLTIYDDWGRKKLRILKELGFKVEVLYEKTLKEKHISSSMRRERIRKEESWEELVTPRVYKYIIENKIDERIRLDT